jgi:hypothetical protein
MLWEHRNKAQSPTLEVKEVEDASESWSRLAKLMKVDWCSREGGQQEQRPGGSKEVHYTVGSAVSPGWRDWPLMLQRALVALLRGPRGSSRSGEPRNKEEIVVRLEF